VKGAPKGLPGDLPKERSRFRAAKGVVRGDEAELRNGSRLGRLPRVKGTCDHGEVGGPRRGKLGLKSALIGVNGGGARTFKVRRGQPSRTRWKSCAAGVALKRANVQVCSCPPPPRRQSRPGNVTGRRGDGRTGRPWSWAGQVIIAKARAASKWAGGCAGFSKRHAALGRRRNSKSPKREGESKNAKGRFAGASGLEKGGIFPDFPRIVRRRPAPGDTH